MATDARNKMTQNNNKYRKIRINGREFRLVPRSDGRFNLMAEGQRGAAGSTAIVGRREGKKLLQKLKALENVDPTVNAEDSEVVNFDAYMEDDENTVVSLDAEFDSFTDGDFKVDEVYNGWNEDTFEPAVVSESKEVEVFTYESDETSDRFVSKEMVISYPAGTVDVSDEKFNDEAFMEGDVSFTDERFVPEELKEKYRKNEKITVSDWVAAAAVTGGSLAARYADLKGTQLYNHMMEHNLRNLQNSLSEIKAAAKNDLVGAPLMVATGGAAHLTTKALKAHAGSMERERRVKQKRDAAEIGFYKRENQRAWGVSQALKADDYLDAKMPPLKQELEDITADVERSKETAKRLKLIEAHPLFNLTDDMIAEQRREAAAARDVEKLAFLKGVEVKRDAAKKMYADLSEEYKKMPTVAEMSARARETKTKMSQTINEAKRIKSQRMKPEEFDSNITPYSVDDTFFGKNRQGTMHKIDMMKSKYFSDALKFALFRGQRTYAKRNPYLRMSYERV